ncbi:MAG: hypothetical protein HKL91_04175 [Candidatus Eremiobacteraeota bacterium]|uniref:Uncharacterized protein n=1 Tax=mine drainage metagenome TaxID=410659 RepID=E6PEW5_9ZZZZ|nr:hypothetical protein [Candidatus Eremiobacteraeota bacterium]
MHEKPATIDFSSVPESGGIPKAVIALVVFGVIAVFTIGGSVIFNAGFHHLWPSLESLRIKL